jgi:hypothetical protein
LLHSENGKWHSKGWRPKAPYRQSRKPIRKNIFKVMTLSEVKDVEGTRNLIWPI